jgi:DNA repair ATPase RecN
MAKKEEPTRPLDVAASDLARLTEDELGNALAKIRAAIKDADEEDLPRLRDVRDRLTKRLDRFVLADLGSIDRDPRIKDVVNQLAELTLNIQTAAREMRTVKKTIDRATEILGYVDQFLRILARFV